MTDPVYKPTKPFRRWKELDLWGCEGNVPWVEGIALRDITATLDQPLTTPFITETRYVFPGAWQVGMPRDGVVVIHANQAGRKRTAYLHFHDCFYASCFYEMLVGQEE